jgi:hypothetical protein
LLRDARDYLNVAQFGRCQTLLIHVQDQSLARLEEGFARQRYYLEQLLHRQKQQDQGASGGASRQEAVADEAAGNSAPEDFTTTNTQHAGVDEPDIVKTNGTHLFTLSGSTVHIVKSWPAEEMNQLATIQLDGRGRNLLLIDNQLVVTYHPQPPEPANSDISPQPVMDSAAPYPVRQRRRLGIAVFDIGNPAEPQKGSSWAFDGRYIAMRALGSRLYLVQTQGHSWPSGLVTSIPYWQGSGGIISVAEFDRQVADVMRQNEAIIRQQDLNDFFASYADSSDKLFADDEACARIFAPQMLESFGLTKVTRIDLADNSLQQSALLVPSQQIYVSSESLYVSSSASWMWRDLNDWRPRTFIHKFDIRPAADLAYGGSGHVSGVLNNQFSMDEHNGTLRLAVTQTVPRDVETLDRAWWWQGTTTVNRVMCLQLKDQQLKVIGQTEPLAPGERIYSARFNGPKGFVVTFRQVDPLYTFDLSDPNAPRRVGELKIPGFSTYIHLLDENHLLAVGRAGDQTGRIFGLKISIFDVTDFASPQEKHTYILENTWSEAEYNHHAFTYFASRQLLGLPIGGWRMVDSVTGRTAPVSQLQVFDIDPAAGISSRGAIDMSDIPRSADSRFGGWWSQAQVRRSVFADDIIYSFSHAGIKAVHNRDLTTPLASFTY